MIASIEDVADPLLPLPASDVDSSYMVLFLVLVVGGQRMVGGVSLTCSCGVSTSYAGNATYIQVNTVYCP